MILRRSISVLALLFLFPQVPAGAYEFRAGDGTNLLEIAAGETLAAETLLVGNGLDVRGAALRDLWLLSAMSVRFGGTADGDLRAFGRSVVLDGNARQNLLAYAAGFQLTTNGAVRGEAIILGNTVVCEGLVEGDAWIVARSVTLGGRWGGNVSIQADEIRFVPGTSIAGTLAYAARKRPVIDPSVSIGSLADPESPLVPEASPSAAAALQNRLLLNGYLFLAAMLVGMPFVGFFPLLAGGAVRHLRGTPWRVLLAGGLTVLLVPFLIAFAFMTVVGIPLGILLGASYVLLAYLSHVVVALWIGHALLRHPGPQTFGRVLSALATGLFILYFIAALPGAASLILLPVLVLGTGALVTSIFHRPRFAMLRPPPMPPLNNPESPDQPET